MFSRKFIIRGLALIGIYIATLSYIMQNEEKFFFKHEKLDFDFSYSFEKPFREMKISVNEELNLHALYFFQKKALGVVLYFPSGDYESSKFQPENNFFLQKGYSVLIPNYRGSGKSIGKYKNEDDIFQDAEQWYKLAKSLADSSKLIIYGKDFGTGAASWVGGEFPADIVFLENPFYSWKEIMLKKYFWWLPYSYFTHYQIPEWEYIRKSMNKTILIHATQASFIHYDNSLQLLEYLKPGDELITLEAKQVDELSKDYQKNMEKILSSK